MRAKALSYYLIAVVLVLAMTTISIVKGAEPSGGDTTYIGSERGPSDAPEAVPALAGNVSFVNIAGYSITQSWQGFVGNVTGVIELTDADNNTLYNWSVASPEGEVYASTNATVTWTNIQCFNYTSDNTEGDEASTRGDTSQTGKNLSSFLVDFNMSHDDDDGINQTFNLIGSAQGHDQFFTNNLLFEAGECQSTRIFGDTGQGVNSEFEEVLLYDPTGVNLVFATIIEDNLGGFDQSTYDFEMIVLEDGHGTDVSTTNYYFYVEIE